MIHRVIFALDMVAILIACRAIADPAAMTWAKWTSRAGALCAVLLVATTWSLFTFPRECWGRGEALCWDGNPLLAALGVHRVIDAWPLRGSDGPARGLKTTSLEWPPTSLQLAHEDFVDDVKIPDLSKIVVTRNLRGRSLIGANLSSTDLRQATLVDTDLRVAMLDHARLAAADLSGANLRGARLIAAQLHGAVLGNAQMQGAYLFEAQMQGAYLFEAQMQRAHLVEAQMQGASLRRVQIQGATLASARMQGVDLLWAEMQGTVLGSARMRGADLQYARMRGANLQRARMRGADLRDVAMQGVDLRNALMQDTYLLRAHMQGADLAGAQMDGALLERTSLWRTDPRTIVGKPIIIAPDLRPLHRPEALTAAVRAVIGPNLRPGVAERLAALSAPWDNDLTEDQAADLWAARPIPADADVTLAAAEARHARAFREAILDYACSDEPGVAAAVAGMFRWRLRGPKHAALSGEIEACRAALKS